MHSRYDWKFPFFLWETLKHRTTDNKIKPSRASSIPCHYVQELDKDKKKYTLQPVQIPNKKNQNLPRRRNSTAWLPFLLFTDPGRAEPTPHSSQVQLHPHRERKTFRRSRCRDNVYGFLPFVQEESPGPTDRRDTSPRVPRHQHSGTPSVPQKWLNLTP